MFPDFSLGPGTPYVVATTVINSNMGFVFGVGLDGVRHYDVVEDLDHMFHTIGYPVNIFRGESLKTHFNLSCIHCWKRTTLQNDASQWQRKNA